MIIFQLLGEEYWDMAARKDPYCAICDGATKEQFDKAKSSLADKHIDFNKEMVFLDLGCGIGRIAKGIAPKVKEYYGADVSANMIKLARERNKELENVFFFKNDGCSLKTFKDNFFDAIVAELLVQHITKENFKAYLLEIHRVLKPTGKLAVQVPIFNYYKKQEFSYVKEELPLLFKDFTFKKKFYGESGKEAYFEIIARKKHESLH